MTLPALARPSARLLRDRADAGDRQHAERDAGDENAEAAQCRRATRARQNAAPDATWAGVMTRALRRSRFGHLSPSPLRSGERRLLEPARVHVQHPVAALRQRGVVGDQHQCRAMLAMATKQQFDDLAPGCLVEIAGRFVGDDDRGIRRERAGERDALLLAAGKFGRIMAQPAAKPDGHQFALGTRQSVARAGEFERHGDIFQRRHGRDEMKGLEDDADIPAAKTRKFVLVSLCRFLAGNDDRAGIGPLQPGHHHEQR